MKKTKVILEMLLLAILFMGCNKKAEASGDSGTETKAEKAAKNAKPNPESDFEIETDDGLTYVTVTSYKGKSSKVVITETIQGLPVMNIHFKDKSLNNATLVVFPNTVKNIYALYIGANLKEGKYADVVLPEGLISIRSISNSKISSLNFPSTLKYLGKESLAHLNLGTKSLVLPETLELIGMGALNGIKVETLTLPNVSGKLFLSIDGNANSYELASSDQFSQINIPNNIAEHYRFCASGASQALNYYNVESFMNIADFMKVIRIPAPFKEEYLPITSFGTITRIKDKITLRNVISGEKIKNSIEFQKQLNINIPLASDEERVEFCNNLKETLKQLPKEVQGCVYYTTVR